MNCMVLGFQGKCGIVGKTVKILSGDKNLPSIEPQREETCLRGLANNTGADQPAHPCSLISAFVIRVLESTISKLAPSEISVF